jgi:hypothetical protein
MINNSTCPIYLNVAINGSLIGPSREWWDYPSAVALIGLLAILFGAIAAGWFQFRIERLQSSSIFFVSASPFSEGFTAITS